MGLRSDLSYIIPDQLLRSLPDGYEIIGDIAILKIPDEVGKYTDEIVRSIISRRPSVKTILKIEGGIKGEYRTRVYKPVFGHDTITEHKESGYRYRIDISEVFFTGKLAYERKRIEDLISPGESVLVPYAGVGPFAIPPAAHKAKVIAIEINPSACRWLLINVKLNSVSACIEVIQADARDAYKFMKTKFDRIISPAPYGVEDSIYYLLFLLKKGGIMHWVTFCNIIQIHKKCESLERRGFQVLRFHRCGNVAPSISRWILDIKRVRDDGILFPED